jgi:hypothetical protein
MSIDRTAGQGALSDRAFLVWAVRLNRTCD